MKLFKKIFHFFAIVVGAFAASGVKVGGGKTPEIIKGAETGINVLDQTLNQDPESGAKK